jgi:hypothetical protein
MIARRMVGGLVLAAGLVLTGPGVAWADLDCKESPTPDVPGQGLTGFVERPPDPLPPEGDPFAPGASTTIYQQYGYAGLRWHTYDLGCGPDAARHPDAVIGTAVSNWLLNLPIMLAALTGAVTDVAFAPAFLDAFDPLIGRVSSTLYLRLFAEWVPVVLAVTGFMLVLRARRARLSTGTAAIGWALLVLVAAATLFRWPVHAGHMADDTVTSSLGAVVRGLNRTDAEVSPGVAAASLVHEQILYRNWLAGELGSADTATARRYGPGLFDAQALTWREARVLETDPEAGRRIIEAKREKFGEIADRIRDTDPAAYEHLTGKRADTRVGFALLTTVAVFVGLPFLLVASLLLLGSYLIVRLAVMLFPALAILGMFPPARGVVVGTGRVVGAALVNAVIFGIGAAVTITGIGVILDPQSRLPGWLAVVLLPLFTFMMWLLLKPFRRLTALSPTATDPFGEATGAAGSTSRRAGRITKKAGVIVAGSVAGSTSAALVAGTRDHRDDDEELAGAVAPERAEARPGPEPTPPVQPPGPVVVANPVRQPPDDPAPASSTASGAGEGAHHDAVRPGAPATETRSGDDPIVLPATLTPSASEAGSVPAAIEPEVYDGEEVYTIYRPDQDGDETGTDGADDDQAS